MKPEEFEQWLIDQAEEYALMFKETKDPGMGNIYSNLWATYKDVLAKYKTVLPPPHTLN